MTQNIFRIGDTVRISDIGLQKIANISKREEMNTMTGKILTTRKITQPDIPTGNPHREKTFIYYVEWNRKGRILKSWQKDFQIAKVSPV